MRASRILLIILIIVLVGGLFMYRNRSTPIHHDLTRKEKKQDPSDVRVDPASPPSDVNTRDEGFNRRAAHLIYTKHARCRMDCRHIDESEVREVLEKGSINYDKSEPNGRPDPKYALEGITHDQQHVRIIFAQSNRGTVVVTCIDLDKDWYCDCH